MKLRGFLKAGIVGSFFAPISNVFAQGVGRTNSLILQNPLGTDDFIVVLNKVIDFMIYVAIPVCTIMVLTGAYKLATSAGDPAKVKEGRDTILYAAGGFIVVILAKGVAGFVQALIHP